MQKATLEIAVLGKRARWAVVGPSLVGGLSGSRLAPGKLGIYVFLEFRKRPAGLLSGSSLVGGLSGSRLAAGKLGLGIYAFLEFRKQRYR